METAINFNKKRLALAETQLSRGALNIAKDIVRDIIADRAQADAETLTRAYEIYNNKIIKEPLS